MEIFGNEVVYKTKTEFLILEGSSNASTSSKNESYQIPLPYHQRQLVVSGGEPTYWKVLNKTKLKEGKQSWQNI